MIRKIEAAVRAWHLDLHVKIAAVAAADAELAAVCIRELEAGPVEDETPEWSAANDHAVDASEAVPFLLRWYADWLSEKANHAAWERTWELEDDLEKQEARREH